MCIYIYIYIYIYVDIHTYMSDSWSACPGCGLPSRLAGCLLLPDSWSRLPNTSLSLSLYIYICIYMHTIYITSLSLSIYIYILRVYIYIYIYIYIHSWLPASPSWLVPTASCLSGPSLLSTKPAK